MYRTLKELLIAIFIPLLILAVNRSFFVVQQYKRRATTSTVLVLCRNAFLSSAEDNNQQGAQCDSQIKCVSSKVEVISVQKPLFVFSAAAQQGNTVSGNTKRDFCTQKTNFGRYPLDLIWLTQTAKTSSWFLHFCKGLSTEQGL